MDLGVHPRRCTRPLAPMEPLNPVRQLLLNTMDTLSCPLPSSGPVALFLLETSMPKPAMTIRPGLWVQSLHGESDLAHDGQARHAAPGSWGYVTDASHGDEAEGVYWKVLFASGCLVMITEAELLDATSYELQQPSTALQLLLSMAWCNGPGQLSLSDEPLCIDMKDLLEHADSLGRILREASALVAALRGTPQAELPPLKSLKALLSADGILPWAGTSCEAAGTLPVRMETRQRLHTQMTAAVGDRESLIAMLASSRSLEMHEDWRDWPTAELLIAAIHELQPRTEADLKAVHHMMDRVCPPGTPLPFDAWGGSADHTESREQFLWDSVMTVIDAPEGMSAEDYESSQRALFARAYPGVTVQ